MPEDEHCWIAIDLELPGNDHAQIVEQLRIGFKLSRRQRSADNQVTRR